MTRNTITRGELREQWRTNVSPLVTAVREGAVQAREVGRREWARAHRRARMRRYTMRWRRPWVAVAAALAIVGVIGGLRAARAGRSRTTDPDLAAVRDEAKAGVRARMEAGRERLRAVAPGTRETAKREPGQATAPRVHHTTAPPETR